MEIVKAAAFFAVIVAALWFAEGWLFVGLSTAVVLGVVGTFGVLIRGTEGGETHW